MLCPKCGAENGEGSVFCNKCGTNLSDVKEEKNILKKFISRGNILERKTRVIAICSALAIIGIVIGILYFNNSVVAFENNIKSNKYSEATNIYEEKIKGNTDKEKKVNSFLKDDITKIQRSFSEGKINYDTAKTRLETIDKTNLASSDVRSALNEIDTLNNSRIAFSKAEEFLKNNDLVNAIKEFKNVIEKDSNYQKAQGQIVNNEKQYKEQVLKTAEDSVNANDLEKAVSIVKDATSIIPNDNDLIAKLSVYEKQLEAKKAEEKKQQADKAQAEQQVVVQNAGIVVQDSTYKALYPDMVQVIVKNSSNKTIKNLDVGILGYDKNGYPLKIKTQFNFSGGGYEFIGKATDVNIIAGNTFGDGYGWKLDETHGISKILACVKRATFYDGTTWDNPYYEYWVEQYKEKPQI